MTIFSPTTYEFPADTYPSYTTFCQTVDLTCVTAITGSFLTGVNESTGRTTQVTVDGDTLFSSTLQSGTFNIDVSGYTGSTTVCFRQRLDGTTYGGVIYNLNNTGSATTPTAAFSGSPTSGNVDLEVTFTNTTTGCPASTYGWTFGDGDTSTTTSPVHTYDAGGLYSVVLTATNTQGSDGETKSDYITVYEAPSSAEVSGDDLVLVSVSKDYTVTPTGGYYSSLTYLWTVTGDGVIASDYTLTNSTSETCSITFNSAEVFEVNCAVTAKDSGGSAIGSAVSDTLEVSAQNCIAAFSADTTTPLQFATVTFTNASTGTDLTYLWTVSGTEDTDWEFANDTTETDEDIEITFLNSGDYDVSLQVYKTLVACDLETKSSYISVSPVVTAQSMRKSFCIVVNNTSYRNVR